MANKAAWETRTEHATLHSRDHQLLRDQNEMHEIQKGEMRDKTNVAVLARRTLKWRFESAAN